MKKVTLLQDEHYHRKAAEGEGGWGQYVQQFYKISIQFIFHQHQQQQQLALRHSWNFAKVGSPGVARNSKQFAILKQHPAVCLWNFRRSYTPSIIARFVEGIPKYSYPFIFLKLIMDSDVCAKLVIFKQQIFQCLQHFKKSKKQQVNFFAVYRRCSNSSSSSLFFFLFLSFSSSKLNSGYDYEKLSLLIADPATYQFHRLSLIMIQKL